MLFCKAQESSKFYKLNEVKKYIIEEIKRLKYYRLEELLTDPPKVEVIWTSAGVAAGVQPGSDPI